MLLIILLVEMHFALLEKIIQLEYMINSQKR